MNIILRTHSGNTVFRPDSSRNHNAADYYVPESVNALAYSPVVYVRLSRAGKCIASKFASRYYDAVNFGLLLYPSDLLDGSEEGFAAASCLDGTSILPFHMYQPITLGSANNDFVIFRSDKEIFRCKAVGMQERIEEAIVEASRFTRTRTGDLLALELEGRSQLCSRGEGGPAIRMSYCNNVTADFKIVF